MNSSRFPATTAGLSYGKCIVLDGIEFEQFRGNHLLAARPNVAGKTKPVRSLITLGCARSSEPVAGGGLTQDQVAQPLSRISEEVRRER